MRVLLEMGPGASERAGKRITKLMAPMSPIWVPAGPTLVPDADVVLLLDGGTGDWALRRTVELRRRGFGSAVIVLLDECSSACPGLSATTGVDAILFVGGMDDSSILRELELLASRDDLGDPVSFALVPNAHEVRIGEVCVVLKPTGFDIFSYLAARRPHWAKGPEIIRDVFETTHDPDSSLVRVHLHTVRKRLDACVPRLGKIVEGRERHGFRLNLRAEEARSAIAQIRGGSGTYSAVSSILLVEDDPIVSRAFDRVLRARGLEVTRAFDCAGARVHHRTFRWALIDVGLPDGDGIDLGAELVGTGRVDRVTFMSAHPTSGDEARARAMGPLIHKSKGAQEIVSALRDAG